MGDIIESILFIPIEMRMNTLKIEDLMKPPVQTRKMIVEKARPLITPEMNEGDISRVIDTLEGFLLKIPEDELGIAEQIIDPEIELTIENFAKFIKDGLDGIRTKTRHRKIDSQIIYAASMIQPKQRKEFLIQFKKFSPSYTIVSSEEILSRFRCLSRVPFGMEKRAVSSLNRVFINMEDPQREEVTNIAASLAPSDWENFITLLDQLHQAELSPFSRFYIIKAYSQVDRDQRRSLRQSPRKSYLNEFFLPHYDDVTHKERYLRFLYLSRFPENRTRLSIELLNKALDNIEVYNRELIIEGILTCKMPNLLCFTELVSMLIIGNVEPAQRFFIMKDFLDTKLAEYDDFISDIDEKIKEYPIEDFEFLPTRSLRQQHEEL
jgi:hypothetical protein